MFYLLCFLSYEHGICIFIVKTNNETPICGMHHIQHLLMSPTINAFFLFCFTGCVNDRQKQLQQLLKPFPGQKRT